MTSATSEVVRLVRQARVSAIAGLAEQDLHRHFPSSLNHRMASVSASIPTPHELQTKPFGFSSDGTLARDLHQLTADITLRAAGGANAKPV